MNTACHAIVGEFDPMTVSTEIVGAVLRHWPEPAPVSIYIPEHVGEAHRAAIHHILTDRGWTVTLVRCVTSENRCWITRTGYIAELE